MSNHPMADLRTRSLLVDAGLVAGRITVEYRRSPYASLLDTSDLSNPKIILNPDEHPDVLMSECVEQCRELLRIAEQREQQAQANPDLELVSATSTGELMLSAVNDGPATDISARARRRGFGVIHGGASGLKVARTHETPPSQGG